MLAAQWRQVIPAPGQNDPFVSVKALMISMRGFNDASSVYHAQMGTSSKTRRFVAFTCSATDHHVGAQHAAPVSSPPAPSKQGTLQLTLSRLCAKTPHRAPSKRCLSFSHPFPCIQSISACQVLTHAPTLKSLPPARHLFTRILPDKNLFLPIPTTPSRFELAPED
jgi:hypothetical protein